MLSGFPPPGNKQFASLVTYNNSEDVDVVGGKMRRSHSLLRS